MTVKFLYHVRKYWQVNSGIILKLQSGKKKQNKTNKLQYYLLSITYVQYTKKQRSVLFVGHRCIKNQSKQKIVSFNVHKLESSI